MRSPNLIGRRFGLLVITKRLGSDNSANVLWGALCDCGNISTTARTANLIRGYTKSCGCQMQKIKHNHGGKYPSKLYKVWANMKSRCTNSKRPDFKYYGGRGISVCLEWAHSFTSFRDWALDNGYKEGLVIDREDNNGNYEPGNCRFVTRKISQNNRRNSKRSFLC